jgi:UDP-N-acetylmuramate--alanine ligase
MLKTTAMLPDTRALVPEIPVLRQGMRRIHHIHLVGIGGAGMSGIAEVLHTLGYRVSGSDIAKNAMTERLSQLGVTVYPTHEAAQVAGADVVVTSTIINEKNPEVIAAKEKRIPVVPRAMMLSELMRFKYGIAIAGAHGKTTTTSLTASLLAEGGYDPTFVIGGKLNALGCHAKMGAGQYFVAEADESDASFLYLSPMMIVLTNIDADHLEAYEQDYERLKATYLQFVHRLPFYGVAIVCIDNEDIRALLPRIQRPYITYGFHEEADFRLSDYRQIGIRSEFSVHCANRNTVLNLSLNLPGEHNALNATAAVIVAMEQGVKLAAIQQGLTQFQGVGRRFQLLGELVLPETGKAMLIDDYGHHPNEIETTIKSVRAGWIGRRVIMVYQPHRYSRLKALFEDFVRVLSKVDVLLLMDVYAAGEPPIPGASTHELAEKVKAIVPDCPVTLVSKESLKQVLKSQLLADDIVLMQGAGDIYTLSGSLLETGLA